MSYRFPMVVIPAVGKLCPGARHGGWNSSKAIKKDIFGWRGVVEILEELSVPVSQYCARVNISGWRVEINGVQFFNCCQGSRGFCSIASWVLVSRGHQSGMDYEMRIHEEGIQPCQQKIWKLQIEQLCRKNPKSLSEYFNLKWKQLHWFP